MNTLILSLLFSPPPTPTLSFLSALAIPRISVKQLGKIDFCSFRWPYGKLSPELVFIGRLKAQHRVENKPVAVKAVV